MSDGKRSGTFGPKPSTAAGHHRVLTPVGVIDVSIQNSPCLRNLLASQTAETCRRASLPIIPILFPRLDRKDARDDRKQCKRRANKGHTICNTSQNSRSKCTSANFSESSTLRTHRMLRIVRLYSNKY